MWYKASKTGRKITSKRVLKIERKEVGQPSVMMYVTMLLCGFELPQSCAFVSGAGAVLDKSRAVPMHVIRLCRATVYSKTHKLKSDAFA